MVTYQNTRPSVHSFFIKQLWDSFEWFKYQLSALPMPLDHEKQGRGGGGGDQVLKTPSHKIIWRYITLAKYFSLLVGNPKEKGVWNFSHTMKPYPGKSLVRVKIVLATLAFCHYEQWAVAMATMAGTRELPADEITSPKFPIFFESCYRAGIVLYSSSTTSMTTIT